MRWKTTSTVLSRLTVILSSTAQFIVPCTRAIVSPLSLTPECTTNSRPVRPCGRCDNKIITRSGMLVWVPGTLSRKLLLLFTAPATFCARQSNTPLSDADSSLTLSRVLCMRMRSDVTWSLQHENESWRQPLLTCAVRP